MKISGRPDRGTKGRGEGNCWGSAGQRRCGGTCDSYNSLLQFAVSVLGSGRGDGKEDVFCWARSWRL